ncbi:MAG: FAD-binding oxidoreductase [Acidobacteriales bacterium]|nr:FAD-binding oxidoreductase [Terriglobales bacterium]
MTTVAAAVSIVQELARITGPAAVAEDDALQNYEIDGITPAAAVTPASVEQVAEIMRFANAEKLVVVPAGGFTQQHTGRTPERIDIVLSTARLAGVVHYDPGDLTIGIAAGTTLAQFDAALEANGQFLPIDVMLPERATIGGTLASAAHGPLKHGYGGVRDFCIGVSFVTGDGRIAKGGGRVVKNVAGYDLMKLMIGSYGSLGVIVGANFKVFPRPGSKSATSTFMLEFPSLREAVQFRDRLRVSALTPICCELISPRAWEYLHEARAVQREVEDVEPGSFSMKAADASRAWRILLRAAGNERVLERYRRELGGKDIRGREELDLWKRVVNFQAAVASRHQNAMLMSVSLPPTAVEAAILAAEKAGLDNNLLAPTIGRMAVSALVIAFVPLSVDPPSAMQFANAASAFRASLPRDASAVVLRCPKEAKAYFDVWGTSPNDLELMRAVKRALDPNNILNRGRFLV